MRKQAVFGLLAVVLLTVPDFSFAEDIMTYFKVGGELELRPTFSGRISNILWKLNGDLIAEWVDKIVPLDYYGRFKGRTALDTTSGVLVMKNLNTTDQGKYTVEINNKVHPQRFTGKAIKVVPRPDVWVQPISCHSEMDSCTLKCEKENVDIKEAEPISYEWKEDDGRWQPKGMDITISKTASASVKTFTCKMKNPVSEEESDPKVNVFYKEPPPIDMGLAVGLPFFLVLIFSLGILGVKFRKEIMGCLPKKQDDVGPRTINGSNTRSLSDGSLVNHEASPLHKDPVKTEAPESA